MTNDLMQKKLICLLGVSFIQLFMFSQNLQHTTNKIIPQAIAVEVTKALSYYPSLKKTPIEFEIRSDMKTSFMKAQPKFSSLFKSKKNRTYKILISETFSLENKELKLTAIPSTVLIGWFGHELGHIMDYKERNTLNLIWFGIRYYFSGNYIRKAERIADSYAVSHHMKDYILQTKNFILNHTELSEKYKAKIKRLYVSPDELLKIVEDQETQKLLTQ
ncbi:hypothetical protein [Aquimarina agarilytica]|uniref:hypothetical protein n=1 Tax=Aquimarina agarilytica TaxID=1087449 RepID=UPI00028834AA|nr:hypothetical protein [Aquimarina agarilytica]